MPRNPGRHELGQNFLVARSVVDRIVAIASRTTGPLVEWGAGDGALTLPLERLGRPLEAVELDPCRADRLRGRVGPHVCISEGDILRHAPPAGATVVCNVPFHLTTPVLRHLLAGDGWRLAVLLVQWEVAKKRAGVGGTTQLTAQWWPWFEFRLDRRVPAAAFRPRPTVDGGILIIERRAVPLLPADARRDYQNWVRRVFTGRGRSLPEILARAGRVSEARARRLCRDQGIAVGSLPRQLTAPQWTAAYLLCRREPPRMPVDQVQ
jgi:23S rRNA (adenine-N6)-dimethyltransferase